MEKIDCRGRACPEPVVMTKKALDGMVEGTLTILLDDPASCENVERFVRSQGCSVSVEKREKEFSLRIVKGSAREEDRAPEKVRKVVGYISSDLLGVGDEALGAILMRAFFKTLLDLETKPDRLIFINSGVRLTSEGSEVLESLKALSEKRVDILSCGTCLDFYGLKEKLRVGRVSNMYEIAQSLLEADHVVRP